MVKQIVQIQSLYVPMGHFSPHTWGDRAQVELYFTSQWKLLALIHVSSQGGAGEKDRHPLDHSIQMWVGEKKKISIPKDEKRLLIGWLLFRTIIITTQWSHAAVAEGPSQEKKKKNLFCFFHNV